MLIGRVTEMLQARWKGYEIDSSEAAYGLEVKDPPRVGTLMRAFVTSGYFVRSFYLLSEQQMRRLQQWVTEHEVSEGKICEVLDAVVAKFNDERWSRIGVRQMEAIGNYVGEHAQELLDAQLFRFELTDDQREDYQDADIEFEPGGFVDESDFYSEYEIPMDGTVMMLGCRLVTSDSLRPAEWRMAHRVVRQAARSMDEFGGPMFGGSWADLLAESIAERTMNVSLRVRLNPDATFAITGRWMEDGQFLFDYYSYLLEQAAKHAEAEIDFNMLY
jgi:hypothetical protein